MVLILGEEIGHHLDRAEAWIEGFGVVAPVVFALGFTVLSSVFVPDLLLGVIAGAAFGFPRGLLAVMAGTLMGALLQRALGRHLLRRPIARLMASRPALGAVQAAVDAQEFRLQLLLRLTPLNRALTSYLLGAGGVGVLRFVAACIGLVPSIALEVYFGAAGKHLARMAGASAHGAELHDVVLVGGLVAALAAMVAVSRSARRAVDAATAGLDGSTASPARQEASPHAR